MKTNVRYAPFATLAGIALTALGTALTQPAAAAEAHPTATNLPAAKPATAPASPGDTWTELFDGRTLDGWKPTKFGGAGEVEVKDGAIVLPMGAMLTGVTFTNPIPRINYEVSLEAKRVMGSDFFCALTAPYNNTNFTFVIGGWGGGIVGISSLDGYDASENDTTKFTSFEKDRWYMVRLRVTQAKIEAWIDGDKLINATVTDRRVGMRFGEIELSAPLGIATYQTTGAIRLIKIRSVTGPDSPPR